MNHKKKTNLLKSIKKRIVFYDSPQKKKYIIKKIWNK